MIGRKNSVFPRECRRCNVVYTEDGFTTYPYQGQRYHRSFCKQCMLELGRKRVRPKYKTHTEEAKQRHRASVVRCRAKAQANGLCTVCHDAPADSDTLSCTPCRTKRNAWGKEQHSAIRKKVFDHYGWVCSCKGCGRDEQEFLTIDHIGGWGKEHRLPSGYKVSGLTLYRWIIRNKFPNSLRTLCYNCNCSQAHAGYCPHERGSKLTREKE